MELQLAKISLLGDRIENQDRVGVFTSGASTLLVVVDGMGGHANGGLAASTALESIRGCFDRQITPLFDPLGFMHLALGRAHQDVVKLGVHQVDAMKPRATVALCLVQQGVACWAHVGDSRVYHLRNGRVLERTRDHSHVEALLNQGKITEADMPRHPKRHLVESGLGGSAVIPEMSCSGSKRMSEGDVLLLCTDGIWSALDESALAGFAHDHAVLQTALEKLGQRAVSALAPFSDNASAAVLRYP